MNVEKQPSAHRSPHAPRRRSRAASDDTRRSKAGGRRLVGAIGGAVDVDVLAMEFGKDDVGRLPAKLQQPLRNAGRDRLGPEIAVLGEVASVGQAASGALRHRRCGGAVMRTGEHHRQRAAMAADKARAPVGDHAHRASPRRKLGQEMDARLDAAEEGRQAEAFVRRMHAVIGHARPISTVGMPSSSCSRCATGIVPPLRTNEGSTPNPLCSAACAARAARWSRRITKGWARNSVRTPTSTAGGAMRGDEAAQQRVDLARILVGHKAEVELGGGARRDHRLRPGPA